MGYVIENLEPEHGSEQWKAELSKSLWKNQEVYELSLNCSKAELGRVMQVMAWMDIYIEGSCTIGHRPNWSLDQMKSVSAFYLIRMDSSCIEEFKNVAQLKDWQLRPATVAHVPDMRRGD